MAMRRIAPEKAKYKFHENVIECGRREVMTV
jgi:hypothetical protein